MFDTRQFIKEECGGPRALAAGLAEVLESPPALNTIKKWFVRASMPSDMLAFALIWLESTSGAAVSLKKYVEGKNSCVTPLLRPRPGTTGEPFSVFE